MKLSQTLLKQAQELRNTSPEAVAVHMLKQAGLSEDQARTQVAQELMEKEATSSLVSQGVDYDTAIRLVKVADIKISDLTTFTPTKTSEELLAESLEKAAAQIEAMEAELEKVPGLLEKVANLEEQLELHPDEVKMPESLTKLAESGVFTNADLDAMMKLPSETLSKVAASQDTTPWSMGKSANMQSGKGLDPLAAWILSE
jgi:predicted DNA-binding ArsR family transcriptional regulator